MRTTHWLSLIAAAALLAGCQELTVPVSQAPPTASTPAADSPAASPAPVAETPAVEANPAQEAAPSHLTYDPAAPEERTASEPAEFVAPVPTDAPPAEQPPATERVEAQAGVGERGQSLTPGSIITEPARAYFRVEQRVTFIQLERALQLYKATNNSVPQTTEEYLEQIVKPNGVTLPKLPQGHRYVFDPQQEKLLVEWTRK